MYDYYAVKGYSTEAQLLTNSSNKYFVFSSTEGSRKLVIAGISNQSRLNNALLQLKFLGVDLDKVVIRGNFQAAVNQHLLKLQKKLQECQKGAKPTLAFIGTSWLVFKELYEHLYPGKLDTSKDILEQQREVNGTFCKHHKQKICDIGDVIQFKSVQVKMKGQPATIVAFKMPYGSLSGLVTEEILKAGFKHICMVGAGGCLDKQRGGDLGALQIIEKSSYRTDEVSLPEEWIMDLSDLQGVDD